MVSRFSKSASIAVSVMLAFSGFSLIQYSHQAFAQGSDIIPFISTDSTIIAGRIVTELEPVQNRTNMDTMPSENNNMTGGQEAAMSQAQQFSMAKNVTWLLNGDWALVADENGNNITFAAEFIKLATDGSMLHTHSIANFRSSDSLQPDALEGENVTVSGTADVYFNDDLAWRQVDTDLTLINGTVLKIDLDSGGIDDHFHGEPIYGVVNSFTKDGTVVSLPETNIAQEVQEELSDIRANATEAGQNIVGQTSQAADTFAEETAEVMGNITQSIRDLFG